MNDFIRTIKVFFARNFSLQDGREGDALIQERIRKNVDFHGANLWALIFAVFIASIGLNVNSTAVIIGAMLISPIMGPVMGIGLGIAVNDLGLIKRSGRNLLIATLFSILTSTLYFCITPLHEAQSELLARTSPSIWDVFIALFGGLAGMVAASREERTNVIPGVAIATALMPPLCTTGFGLANGNWFFSLGAIYLYFINSVFIAIATFLIARYLRLKRVHFRDSATERRVNRYLIGITLVTILPSILLAYRIVDKSIFESNARRFVEEKFRFPDTQVVLKSFNYNPDRMEINLLLIGKEISQARVDTLAGHLREYGLPRVRLNVKQGLNARQEIDFSQIKASILEDVFGRQSKPDTMKSAVSRIRAADSAVARELHILYPGIRSLGLTDVVLFGADGRARDTTLVALVSSRKPISSKEANRLRKWLRARYEAKELRVVIQ
ncbi:TIGR00341 family protein [Siphonobacter aquaeclarae]|uniref:TIGR00341 family protein n=1 Tax=Siphonobacter aquaeclarae TaxID=563176 RepID=A0A1G9YKI0_9BACT|nr:TIGR00341 family protein [Siphonobacter aquaeclarae]SDN09634.1 TIGR00341 family protein [Siphonobacter aquaeclarae]